MGITARLLSVPSHIAAVRTRLSHQRAQGREEHQRLRWMFLAVLKRRHAGPRELVDGIDKIVHFPTTSTLICLSFSVQVNTGMHRF